MWLMRMQSGIPWPEKDYSYIDLYQKAYDNDHDAMRKENILNTLKDAKVRRDYNLGSMKQINHAIQFDQKPNTELKEAQCEIYRITINSVPISKMPFSFIFKRNVKLSCYQ